MLQYFLQRLLALLPKILIITLLIFFGLELIPGDAITRTMPPEMLRGLSEAQLEELREARGLIDPAVDRYVRWLGDLVQGDLGYSTVNGKPIREFLASRQPATA